MTLADELEHLLVERGPLPATELAPAVRRRRSLVLETLHADPRFTRTGKRRAARWHVVEVRWPEGFEDAEEALVRQVSQLRSSPEDALLRIVTAWGRSDLLEVAA